MWWKRSHIPHPEIPNPTSRGWKMSDGPLQPHWFDGNKLPDQLVGIAARNEELNYLSFETKYYWTLQSCRELENADDTA